MDIENKDIGKTVYVNLNTEKVEELPEIEQTQNSHQEENNFFTYTNFTDVHKTLSTIYDNDNARFILSNAYGNDVSNIYLFSKYPMLKDSVNSENISAIQIYENISADTLAHWLVAEKEDPYQGVVLDAKNSKDGEEHKINSMEDFNTWIKE